MIINPNHELGNCLKHFKILEQLDELKKLYLGDKGALDASEAGLKPDAGEDETKKLEELIARVAKDDALHTLFVPEGDYLIKGSIQLRPQVNLIGEGMGRTWYAPWSSASAYALPIQAGAKMTQMGFYTPYNCGPLWVHVNDPKPGDFVRLKGEWTYEHVLPAHGEPVVGDAMARYAPTFQRLFGV